ncbi:Unknown protein sequence [Pseudomonas amygdali pv. lachrymans]|uniref:Uncharacterized protein n=1 Tax=Pseudomonas amygdali pv. lachrymans TaxID=53707 RepID=A0ABR5KYM8_PSEAV|nr:Unknown protein sequence [Pseudomonas amygdali pv. lachrymans]KPC19954.1 Unknown protein sequence [Pseudomonas amygdali pv. lachrymans]
MQIKMDELHSLQYRACLAILACLHALCSTASVTSKIWA